MRPFDLEVVEGVDADKEGASTAAAGAGKMKGLAHTCVVDERAMGVKCRDADRPDDMGGSYRIAAKQSTSVLGS